MNASNTNNYVFLKVGDTARPVRRHELVNLTAALGITPHSPVVSIDQGETWTTIDDFLKKPVSAIAVADWQDARCAPSMSGSIPPLSPGQVRPRMALVACFAVAFFCAFTPWAWIQFTDSEFNELSFVVPGFALLGGIFTALAAATGFVIGCLELSFVSSPSFRALGRWTTRVAGAVIGVVAVLNYLMLWWLRGLPVELAHLGEIRYTLQSISVIPMGLLVQVGLGIAVLWISRLTWTERSQALTAAPA